jgi:hypothetical protein
MGATLAEILGFRMSPMYVIYVLCVNVFIHFESYFATVWLIQFRPLVQYYKVSFETFNRTRNHIITVPTLIIDLQRRFWLSLVTVKVTGVIECRYISTVNKDQFGPRPFLIVNGNQRSIHLI